MPVSSACNMRGSSSYSSNYMPYLHRLVKRQWAAFLHEHCGCQPIHNGQLCVIVGDWDTHHPYFTNPLPVFSLLARLYIAAGSTWLGQWSSAASFDETPLVALLDS